MPTDDASRIQDALRFIPSDIDRESWVRVGMAVKSSLGDGGFAVFDEWSARAENYNKRDAAAVWKSIDAAGPVTAGTLFYEAKTHGWRGAEPRLPPATLDALRRDIASIAPRAPHTPDRDAEALRAEQARQANRAAALQAASLLRNATGDPTKHPYYVKKRTAFGEERQLDFGPGVRRGAWPQRGWDDALLVPLRDLSGKLTSIEAINPTGEKDFLRDGKKRGSFYALGEIRDAKTIRITEGVANAAVLGLDGTPTVAAMDAGNLVNVARAVRLIAPNAAIEIGADNDIRLNGKSNTGVESATQAAKEVGGRVIVPDLGGKKADFWDLWQARGSEAVAAAFHITRAKGIVMADVAKESARVGQDTALRPVEGRIKAIVGNEVRVERADNHQLWIVPADKQAVTLTLNQRVLLSFNGDGKPKVMPMPTPAASHERSMER